MHDDDILLSIPSHWDLLEDIRVAVQMRMQKASPELCHAVLMAATELTENAIKYGHSGAECKPATFRFAIRGSEIILAVSNGLLSADHAERVQHRIDQITAASDKMALYIGRLQQLLDGDAVSGSAGLGLYRIAAEGKFTLGCTYRQGVFTVTASRPVESPNGP